MHSLSHSLVSLHGIGKRFPNGVAALEGVDLSVMEGEFLAIVGPSGCGKSTALRIVAGLIEASAGAIDWDGGSAGNDPAAALGFVFQEPTLMPWKQVRDNVYLPLKLAGMSRAQAAPQIADALSRVGLSDFASAFPRELSGGMKMRVSIARALVNRPKLLLMDEPFAALDEITRFRLNADLIAAWQSLRCTVVFVTHSVFEAVFLSSRILVMTPRPGRIFGAVANDAPYPRDGNFRTSADYAARCREVSRLLEAAMARDGR